MKERKRGSAVLKKEEAEEEQGSRSGNRKKAKQREKLEQRRRRESEKEIWDFLKQGIAQEHIHLIWVFSDLFYLISFGCSLFYSL